MDKFRSVALYAEVKLTEALTRVKTMRLKANDGNPVPEDEPDRLRTAVCVQVFSELCKMAGPFSSVLQRLRDEFVLSMYSDYYLSEGGDSVFDQQPYFSAIKRIEQERAQLLDEQERFRDLLMDREEDISEIEDRSSSFAEMMQRTAENTENMQRSLEASEKVASQLRTDLEESNEEVKVLQHEVRLLKLEVDEQTKELSNKESLRVELESLQKQHGVQTNRQQDLLNELSKAKDTIADSVPIQDFLAVKSKLDELLEQIDRANKKEGVAVGVEGILTPRPDWKSLFFGHEGLAEGLAPPSGARTREAAAAVARGALAAAEQHQEARDANARLRLVLEQAEALMAPDPEPRPWHLEVFNAAEAGAGAGAGGRPPESSGSSEEGGGSAVAAPSAGGDVPGGAESLPDGAAEARGGAEAAPLGMGPEVPRFLRWAGEPVPLRELSGEETLARVEAIWEAKRRSDLEAAGGPMSLQAFVYEFLRRSTSPEVGQVTVAREGYSLLWALERHAADLFEVGTFLHVLRGEAGEGLFPDRARMLAGLEAVCRALDPKGEGRVASSSLLRALRGFFPNKSVDAHDTLRAALGGAGGAGGSAGGAVDYRALLATGSAFRIELERQHLEEVVSYVAGLERALGPPSAPGGGDEAGDVRTLAQLSASISSYDPAKPPQDVQLLVARGTGAPCLAEAAADGTSGAEATAVRPFLWRLKRGFLCPAGSYVLADAGELAAREKMDLLNHGDMSTSLPDPV